MAVVDVNTKLVALLGNPLGHSFSPAMHNKAFQVLGLNYFYLPIEVTSENLKDVARGISKMNFAGYNITVPHKIQIMEYLDRVDEMARIIGAVNTVKFEDGVSTGYNTDGDGFILSLESQTGVSIKGKRLFIVGCGGAARSIAMMTAFKGAEKICLCNRTEEKAHNLAAEINEKVRPCVQVIPANPVEMKAPLEDSDILINTTSVGMHPLEDRIPLDGELIHKDLIVSDIVYNPLMTKLLKTAEAKGCKIVTGIGMLVYQGVEAFRIWTDLEPPVDEMFRIVEAAKG